MNRADETSKALVRRVGFGRIGPLLSVVALAVAVGLSGFNPTFADFALTDWKFFKEVVVPPSVNEATLVEAILDREVFQESIPGETDLRLIAGDGTEVPYKLVILNGRSEREPVPVKIRDVGYVPGEYSGLVADLGNGGRTHNEVEVTVIGSNFRRNVQVEASSDGETWAVIREGAEIYDFTSSDSKFNARRVKVGYPESAARYVRVRVFGDGSEQLTINGATFFLNNEIPARASTYTPATVSSSEDEETGASLHVVDMGTSGVPVTRLSFQDGLTNFYRTVGIEGSVDGEGWSRLGGGEIYSFDTARFTGSRLWVEFPESSTRYFRMRVENADDTPVTFTGFTLRSIDRKLLFQAEPGATYSLYYGNPEATAPVYDLERILPYLETNDLPLASLSAQRTNEYFDESAGQARLPLTERLPWLLPTGVALAALLVAVLLYGVVRQARKILPPPSEDASS